MTPCKMAASRPSEKAKAKRNGADKAGVEREAAQSFEIILAGLALGGQEHSKPRAVLAVTRRRGDRQAQRGIIHTPVFVGDALGPC